MPVDRLRIVSVDVERRLVSVEAPAAKAIGGKWCGSIEAFVKFLKNSRIVIPYVVAAQGKREQAGIYIEDTNGLTIKIRRHHPFSPDEHRILEAPHFLSEFRAQGTSIPWDSKSTSLPTTYNRSSVDEGGGCRKGTGLWR